MIHSIPFSRFSAAFSLALLGIFAISCGSYQQASYYDNDGIYSSDTETVEVSPRKVTKKQKENDTYTDYFAQKADQYDEILDSEIFTDVDSYSSKSENDSINSIDNSQLTDYYTSENDYDGYGNWGDNNSNVSITYHNNAWNNSGWGGYGYGYGYGGWNSYYDYGWGYNNPWSYRYYNPWGWGGYGYGYGNNYYNRWNSSYYGYGQNNYYGYKPIQ